MLLLEKGLSRILDSLLVKTYLVKYKGITIISACFHIVFTTTVKSCLCVEIQSYTDRIAITVIYSWTVGTI
jgi:hypothetical protein